MTLKQLQATPAGKINNIPKTYSKKTSGKYYDLMEATLQKFADDNGLVLEKEHRFDQKRRFRFDFAFTAIKICFEHEGILSDKSRHTRAVGYSNDASKYNLAALNGWIVLRYTVLNRDELITDLKKIATTLQK